MAMLTISEFLERVRQVEVERLEEIAAVAFAKMPVGGVANLHPMFCLECQRGVDGVRCCRVGCPCGRAPAPPSLGYKIERA